METIKVEYAIPEPVYEQLGKFIKSTIREVLTEHARDVLVKPQKLTRKETAAKLRVSLPTLLSYESRGLLKPQRIGRRVLFPEDQIEAFLSRC